MLSDILRSVSPRRYRGVCMYVLIQEPGGQVQLESAVIARIREVCQEQTPGASQLLASEVRVTPASIHTYAKGQEKKRNVTWPPSART
jgi:hypothetical protein